VSALDKLRKKGRGGVLGGLLGIDSGDIERLRNNMQNTVDLLTEIRDLLREINRKLDKISG